MLPLREIVQMMAAPRRSSGTVAFSHSGAFEARGDKGGPRTRECCAAKAHLFTRQYRLINSSSYLQHRHATVNWDNVLHQ